jgi:hypothetical protein
MSFKLKILPFDLFPSGSALFKSEKKASFEVLGALYFDFAWRAKQSRPPVSIHANFLLGHFTKRSYLIMNDLWLIGP